MKNNKNGCPNCRTKIDKKKIGVDMIANNYINELEVFCTHKSCSWSVSII